jgi:hypothetical protein
VARRDDSSPARSVVREVLRDSTPARSARAEPVSRREIEATLVAFVREVVKPGRWRVRVPGTHSGGIDHEGLLDVLASQGREFLQNTVQLALAVSAALRRRWLGSSRMPTLEELRATAEPALLDVVEQRFSPGNGDIRVTALTPRYAAQKRARGRGSQPVGVASGELRRAVSRDAYVEWL